MFYFEMGLMSLRMRDIWVETDQKSVLKMFLSEFKLPLEV